MKTRSSGLYSLAKTLACACCISLSFIASTSLSAQAPILSMGDDFGAVVDNNGNLFTWGTIATEVAAGQIQQIEPAEGWADVSVSRTAGASAHILAIRTDGTLWAWGSNSRGQVGDGTTVDRVEPYKVSSATDWVEIAAGEFHSMARRAGGSVYVWGGNSYGQLGFGPISNDPNLDLEKSIGSPIDGNSYIAIAAGKLHCHAIRTDGTLWGWGQNGEAGGNSNGKELGFLVGGSQPVGPVEPTQLGSSTGWTDLFSGYDAVFALKDTASQTGQLWAWGSGALGFGGISPAGSVATPTRVGSGTDWISVSTSKSSSAPHTLGLKSDGSLYGWGVNWEQGPLGLPFTDNGNRLPDNYKKTSPTRLEAGNSFLAVGAGEGFSVIIRNDGFMQTAGINNAGQLANGQTNASEVGQDYFYNSNLGIADLQGTGLTLSTPMPWTDPNISASFSMKNGGTGSIDTPFYISAVLSPTTDYDSVDAIQLEFASNNQTTLEVTSALARGQSLSVPFVFTVPDSVLNGSYYVVARADSTDLIEETSELNNDAATEDNFEFFPDLVVSALTVTGGTYDPGDDLIFDVSIGNQGAGTVPSGSTFDLRLFLSPDKTADNTAAVDLDADPADDLVTLYTVTLTSDLVPGDVLPLPQFDDLLVPRMAEGNYFLGADVDVSNEIEEQTEIVVNNVVLREDGEDNNLSFTTAASVAVDGISIPIAIDQDTLLFETDGDANWFGQSSIYNPNAVSGNDDAVQSPSLAAGGSAEFSTDFNGGLKPYAITFDWKSETSSIDNKLIYRVINGATGGVFNEISGITEWATLQRVVPANARAEWVYEQGVEADSDAVYVDNLQITEITAPDLVIDEIYLPDGATASYVLLKDRLDLTVNSRNQGTSTNGSKDYVISIYLSKDREFDRPDGDALTPDDILIRQETITRAIASGDPAVNGFSITLDADLDAGSYYLIGFIDDYTDAVGATLPGATFGTGQVAEFQDGVIDFDGEDNNQFVSTGTIEIVALPDLEVSGLNAIPDYYLIEDPDTGEANSMEFDFTVANIGLAAVNVDVPMSVLFSEDQIIDPETDYLLLDYNYEGNFGYNPPSNQRQISPDAIDFRQDLVDAGYIGRRLFVGVYIDSNDVVTELDEEHNSSYLLNNDFILSELPIFDGLDLDDTTILTQNLTLTNDEVAPYESDKLPWVGQTTEAFDSYDAVTNTIIGDDETSEFSIRLEPTTGVRVSFWWKVSSQNQLIAGNNQRDVLRFEVDGTQAVADIFGTDEEGWRRVEVALDGGAHTLTWAYIKDDEGSAGEDRGWVDSLIIEEMPNLSVLGVVVDGAPVYAGGGTIDTWSITIENTGSVIKAGTEFDVAVRLLPQASWVESGSQDLITITDSAGLALGETRTYNASTVIDGNPLGSLSLPDIDYAQEFYYVGAYVDWSLLDSQNGQISEFNELDNFGATETASIQFGLPDLQGRALIDGGGVTDINPDPLELTLHLINGGSGALAAGSDFNVIVYASSNNSAGSITSSSSYELYSGPVPVVSAIAAGDSLPDIVVNSLLPYGIPDGDYYIGVVIDSTDSVEEQGPLPSLLRPDQTRADGEANNVFFTAAPNFSVTGISVVEGMDLTSGSFEFDGDADWFGRDDAGDPDTVDDDQLFTDGDGAQSPVLSVGESASFSLAVVNSSAIKFDWAANTLSDQNVLSVTVNGEVIRSVTGVLALESVEPFVVPDGATVKWSYTKGAATVGDVAYLDNLEILSNSLPDLALTGVSHEGGEYVLDRVATFEGVDSTDPASKYLQTKFLAVAATAENLGANLAASTGAFTSADIEVRLSVNDVYGDADDIVLGSFAQVEGDFDSTNLLSFLGPITLGDHIPEGFYHLIVFVDSNDRVAEFTESNNLFTSELADIQITRLPDLIIENVDSRAESFLVDEVLSFADIIDVDETQRYNPGSSVRMRFNIQNIGLGDVDGADSFTTQVNLRGIPRPIGEDDVPTELFGDEPFLSDIESTATDPIILQEFNIQDELNGRGFDPITGAFNGEVKSVDIELFLPAGAYLSTVIAEDKSIQDYLWFFEVIVNRDFTFNETDAFNTWWCVDAGTLLDITSTNWVTEFNGAANDGLFGVEFTPVLTDATAWQESYDEDGTPGAPYTYPTSNPEYLLAYAFNRNPASGDTAGNTFPGSYGIIRVEGETDADDEDFLSITFDFVARATDLLYVVQVDNDVSFGAPDVLLTIDTTSGSYTDTVGPYSLTGAGGLIEQPNVLSVHDQGYSARVTVVDTLPTSATDRRFMRIVVGTEDASSVVIRQSVEDFSLYQMNLLGVSDPADAAADNDFDSDGISNLVELLYDTDPTDIADVPTISGFDELSAEMVAAAIVDFGGALTVPTPNVGAGDDYDGDLVSNLDELYDGTDPADPSDF